MTVNLVHDVLEAFISTHTSLAGRDEAAIALSKAMKFLLTRPSRDVTAGAFRVLPGVLQFLLTRPSRDVTFAAHIQGPELWDFYSHVPRGT